MTVATVWHGKEPDLEMVGEFKFKEMPRPGDTIRIPISGRLVVLQVFTVTHPGVPFGPQSHGALFLDINEPRPPEIHCSLLHEAGEAPTMASLIAAARPQGEG
ncbi:hypothetical protein [Azospirillum argentinense]|uniref:hypothetical protein n=1 Tax=Azospirillum argentinense TaxID=2970906 RepID=UPI0032DE6144